MQFSPLRKHFPLCIHMLVLTFQVTFKNVDVSSLFDAQACHNNDLENNFLCLILSGNRGGLQQYMGFVNYSQCSTKIRY